MNVAAGERAKKTKTKSEKNDDIVFVVVFIVIIRCWSTREDGRKD